MNNEELKEKIVDILFNCKSDRCAIEYCAECEGNPCIENCREKQQADALIAAGIGDVKTAQEIGASATAMAVLEAAKAEHRAEVAERALRDELVQKTIRLGVTDICPWYIQALNEAEKELAEERKDENN